MCLPNPCENGATCTSSAVSYQCQCPANFEGPKCQFAQIYTAHENLCQNGVVCKKNVDSSFDCTCNPGFTGIFCETVIDAFSSNPCQNGASCYRFNFTEYVYSCPVGFSGQNCENDMNECSLNSCQNNGQCVDTFGPYSFVCPIGFAGKDCEQTVADPCLFTSCSANGTDLCVATDNGFGYECKCKPSNCEIMLDTCSSQPCQNEPLASPETASTLVCALTSSKVPTVRTKSTRACHMPAIIAVLVQLCQWVKLQIKI